MCIRDRYVDRWMHLGHVIADSCTDVYDIANRRGSLIGQINNVLFYFSNIDPLDKVRLLIAHCYSFYGSVLWDLSHPDVQSICCVCMEERFTYGTKSSF